jgi:ribonuclease P protein component
MNQSFGKEYKLCSKNQIDEIFESGNTIKSYPFVIKYKLLPLRSEKEFQVVLSAPKRTYRFAYQRNRIKRICREAIRKNKVDLENYLHDNDLKVGLFIIYSAREELESTQLEHKTRKIFKKLIAELDATKQS